MVVWAATRRVFVLFFLVSCAVHPGHAAFSIAKQKGNWDDVRAACQALGGDLAVIRNQVENDEVTALIQAHLIQIGWDVEAKPWGPKYLIGLRLPEGAKSYDGNFEWVDGSPYEFTNWHHDRFNWNKWKCPDDSMAGYPLMQCFVEVVTVGWSCYPEKCRYDDMTLVGVNHGSEGHEGPPGKWYQASEETGGAYGVCSLPETSVPVELEHPNFHYFMSPSLATFADIVQWCDDNDGLIASVLDRRENYELGTLLDAFNWTQDPRDGYNAQVFIGLVYDEEKAEWQWLDGSPFAFANWKDGQPDQLDVRKNTVVQRGFGDSKGFPGWLTAGLWREKNDKPMYGVCKLKPADPGFPTYGHASIAPARYPITAGTPTQVAVTVRNFGASNAENVVVSLSTSDWGLGYGGWTEVGKVELEIPGDGGAATGEVETEFATRALVSLRAEVVEAGRYGNSDAGNDRVQAAWDVVRAEEEAVVWVPFANSAGEAVTVSGTEVLCLFGAEVAPCVGEAARRLLQAGGGEGGAPVLQQGPFLVGAPGQDGAATELGAGEEVVARLEVPEVPEGGLTVVVRAEMGGEVRSVALRVEKTRAVALLNEPWVCCLKGLERRVLLEQLLLDALEAYEAGDCRRGLKMLRLFVQKATLMECEVEEAGLACIGAALLKATDTGLLMARELGQSSKKEGALQEAQYFRRVGLLEAALLEAGKAC